MRTQNEDVHPIIKHTWFDDIFSITIASVLLSFGIALFAHKEFLIGGTAGIAFLIHYATDLSFGTVFFVINLPFYALSIWKLGKVFTLKTFITVFLVSLFSDYIYLVFEFGEINPIYAAVLGGFLIGNGLLILFRHKSSLGGLNIASLYMQKYHDISAGKFQMTVDVLIVIAAFFTVDIYAVLYSVLAAVLLNMVLAANFKPGRYVATS